MAEADTEDGQRARLAHELGREPKVLGPIRSTRSRGEEDAVDVRKDQRSKVGPACERKPGRRVVRLVSSREANKRRLPTVEGRTS